MTTTSKKTTAPRKPRKVKTASKKTTVAAAAAPTKTKEPQVNPHIAAGISLARYNGPSSFVNSNRKVKVMLGREVSPSKVTSRAQAGLYALRDTHGGKQFTPMGFDNGILRDLLGAGLIDLSGGAKQTIDGKEYMLDAETPVVAKITAKGMAYGKA